MQLPYHPVLDELRGVAVLLVMAFHFDVPGAHAAGRIGVTLFLVLSGHLITTQLALRRRSMDRHGLGRFYRRRVLRIVPALTVFLLVISGAAVVTDTVGLVLPAVLTTILGLANVSFLVDVDLLWLAHMWTLALEAQFYLIIPLLVAAAFARRSMAWATAVVLAAVCVIYPPSVALAVGYVLALAGAGRIGQVWPPAVAAAGVATMLVSVAIDNQSTDYYLLPTLVAAIGAGLLVTSATQARRKASGPLRTVGVWSYSLYLWHVPIAVVVFPSLASIGIDWWVGAIVATLASLLIASLSYRLIEQPFMRRRSVSSSEAELQPAVTQ